MNIELPDTVECKLYVIVSPSGTVSASSADMSDYGYATLAVHNLTFDVPQDDPTPKFIEALENKAEDIQAEATASINAIKEQIAQLRCIEYKPEGDHE